MSTLGDSLGGPASRPNLVQGVSIDPKTMENLEPITYSGFGGGINTSDSPEDVPPDSAIFSADMEIDRDDSLIPAPGFSQLAASLNGTTVTGQPIAAFQQAGLDFTQELVVIFGGNGGFNWAYLDTGGVAHTNLGGLSNNNPHGWNACSIAGTLIASNGFDQTATRAAGANTITDISAQLIAARGFALQFGRAFAIGVTPAAGTYQALGVSWDTNGLGTTWIGANAGSQLLIGAETDADACMGVAPLGFDLLVIVNRHSVWFGYPTGVANAPADFRPRTMSIGTPYGATVCATPFGVMFLSDEGVMLVTSTGVACLSDSINPSLLPLVYSSNADTYTAIWSPYKNRYILQTPTGLFIYTIPEVGTSLALGQAVPAGRWTFRSAIVSAIVEYTDSAFSGVISPATLWALKAGNTTSRLGAEIYVGTPATDTYFGTSYTPTWRMPFAAKDAITMNYTTLGFEIEYTSTVAVSIGIQLTDPTGQPLGAQIIKTLPSSGGVIAKNNIPFIGTGLGPSMQITYQSWQSPGATLVPPCKIRRIRQLFSPAGPSISSL